MRRWGPRPGACAPGRGLPSAPGADRSRRRQLTGEGVLPCERPVGGGNLPPPRHSELLTKDIAMRLDGASGDAESLANLLVGAAERDELDHLALPLRESRVRITGSACHGSEPTRDATRQPLAEGSIRWGLDAGGRGAIRTADEGRVMPAPFHVRELFGRQRLELEQEVELVPQVGSHHL